MTSRETEVSRLKAQVATLEELLQVYEQTATEQEQRLQSALHSLQERAEQLSHAQETLETLEAILDSMGDAVVVVDVNGQHLFSNPAAQKIFQSCQTRNHFQNLEQIYQISTLDGETYTAKSQLPLLKAIHGAPLDAVEMRLIKRSTNIVQWLSVNARPLYSDHQIVGGVAVFRDISDRKQVEQELRMSHEETQHQAQLLENTLKELQQTQAQLIHGEKMASLGKTVAGIAHEINNPVSFIHGNLDHAESAFQDLFSLVKQFQAIVPVPPTELADLIDSIDLDFLAVDTPRLLDSMREGTTRIRNIVGSLKTFSRLDEASFKQIDIHQSIDSALELLQPQLRAQKHRSAIRVIKQYGQLPLVECQARQLNQVFSHLLANAIDAVTNTETPTIQVITDIYDHGIEVQILDNGIGIPKDIQPRIFDPFFTTKPVGQGTGLGLSVCHQIIVQSHKGQLTCQSQENQGTQFTISLPV
ncbi:MAG: ATP-binding protein [Cyanobacteria bacterium P01_D01_bin.156]